MYSVAKVFFFSENYRNGTDFNKIMKVSKWCQTYTIL